MSEQTMVEVPKAKLQQLEILAKVADKLYSDYYHKRTQVSDRDVMLDLHQPLTTLFETDDDDWEGWELNKAYDRLYERHRKLQDEVSQLKERIQFHINWAHEDLTRRLSETVWPDVDSD